MGVWDSSVNPSLPQDDPESPCTDWDRYATEQYEILLAEEAYENENENR